MNIFWGSSQNWTILRGYYYAFLCLFVKVKVQNGGYFWGCLIFKYLFGVLGIPDIFLG